MCNKSRELAKPNSVNGRNYSSVWKPKEKENAGECVNNPVGEREAKERERER